MTTPSVPGSSRALRALAAIVLGELVALRFTLDADGERAYLLGHPLPILCWFRSAFHLPCPTCGLTRSLGLSLHGHLAEASRLFPAAPLTLAWLAGIACLVLVLQPARRTAHTTVPRRTWLKPALLAGAALSTGVWLVDYAVRLIAAARGGA